MISCWIGLRVQRSSVTRNALGGSWVFRGTRAQVSALFENLEDGVQLAQFVELFPGVTIEQAREVLNHAAKSLRVSQAI